MSNDRAFYFWVKFDKDPQPMHLRVKTWVEFIDQLDRLVKQHGDFPEWIIRDYR